MARMDDAELIRLDGPGTLDRFEEIQQVYAEAFPSYDLDDHRWRTTRQAESPGFETVIAQVDRRIIGFVYGLPLTPNTRWWDGLTPPRDAAFTAESGTRTFAVIDLAVLPDHRGRGLARRLMQGLLQNRAEERATLATNPHHRDVQAMYEHWGWQKVGQVLGQAHETQDAFDLYVIALGEDPASSSR
jgi:ribosomal protein S18 acetylase RimI-like enzyme